MSSCAKCGKQATKACKKCLIAKYCSAECQRGDWKRHKKQDCKKAPQPAAEEPSSYTSVEQRPVTTPWSLSSDHPRNGAFKAEARWILLDGKNPNQICGARQRFDIPADLWQKLQADAKSHIPAFTKLAVPVLFNCLTATKVQAKIWYCSCGKPAPHSITMNLGTVDTYIKNDFPTVTQLSVPLCADTALACSKRNMDMIRSIEENKQRGDVHAMMWFGWQYRNQPKREVSTFQVFKHTKISVTPKTEQEWSQTWMNLVQEQLPDVAKEAVRNGVPYTCINCGSDHDLKPMMGLATDMETYVFQLRTVDLEFVCYACAPAYFAEQRGGDINIIDLKINAFCQCCGCLSTPEKKLKLCSRCKDVRYCSSKCQTLDWPKHKTVCTLPEVE